MLTSIVGGLCLSASAGERPIELWDQYTLSMNALAGGGVCMVVLQTTHVKDRLGIRMRQSGPDRRATRSSARPPRWPSAEGVLLESGRPGLIPASALCLCLGRVIPVT